MEKNQTMKASEKESPTIESVFNKHSFRALGGISPSKCFCISAMKEWAEIENKKLSESLDYNINLNINLMKRLRNKS